MRTHPLDVTALVFGLTFLGIVTGWALFEVDLIDAGASAWFLPLLLVGTGLVGIVAWSAKAAVRRPRRSPDDTKHLHS